MKNRFAFTMLELIFVIVIMGILGKFGVEFLAQAYNNFIYSSINNRLQSQSATALESIAVRLQYRIKDSVIGRKGTDFSSFEALGSVPAASAEEYTVLEWVASDIEGFRGDTSPYWSGIIDLDESNAAILESPKTNTSKLNTLINTLSDGTTGIDNAALYFIGSNTNINSGYGWDGTSLNDQNGSMHPIEDITGQPTQFAPKVGDFSGIDVYEYYQLAWTAYAIEHNTTSNDLILHYDYQPWEGEKYSDGENALLMQNVDTFRFKAVGSVVKVQVCVFTELVEEYSLCKEKTIF